MKKYLIPVLVLFLSATVSADYVGTAPGVKDLDRLERGEKKLVKFYVVTDLQEPFKVDPRFDRPQATFYAQPSGGRYGFDPDKASQQDISSWVKFDRKNYLVDPATEKVISLENGGVANAQGEISFVLKVPEDAEPGYHVGAVELNPKLSSSGAGGTGVSTLALTQFLFVFRVPGKAERDLKISHVSGFRTSEDRVRVDFLLVNNGTVTTRIARADTKIFNQFGNHTGTITTGGMYIQPGETRVVSSVWKDQDIQQGEYRVQGEMNYITGSTFLDSSIQLQDYSAPITIQPTPEEGQGIPWWIVVMVLVILGVLMYSFDVEPVWILTALGVIGISAYIWVSGLPLYLIGVLILLTTVLAYRWIE